MINHNRFARGPYSDAVVLKSNMHGIVLQPAFIVLAQWH